MVRGWFFHAREIAKLVENRGHCPRNDKKKAAIAHELVNAVKANKKTIAHEDIGALI